MRRDEKAHERRQSAKRRGCPLLSAGIRVGKEAQSQEEKEAEFWPSILGSVTRGSTESEKQIRP